MTGLTAALRLVNICQCPPFNLCVLNTPRDRLCDEVMDAVTIGGTSVSLIFLFGYGHGIPLVIVRMIPVQAAGLPRDSVPNVIDRWLLW